VRRFYNGTVLAFKEMRAKARAHREPPPDYPAMVEENAGLGQLTASIVHEVKQPITATAINARIAKRWLSTQPPNLEEVRNALDRIIIDIGRAESVVERIRDMVKRVPERKDRLEVNGLILEVVALTRGEAINNGVSVETRLAEDVPPVQGDRVQLQQVILNLVINAIEAMSGGGARKLLISSKSESGGVLVAVRDSGPGLAPESVDRVFDAFYTTKPGGFGLGLSICRSIIEAHGGRLWATANVPQGAVFQFKLSSPPDSAA
jgi:signal transduction histidine kinase